MGYLGASPPPSRSAAGGTTDMPHQPFADCGEGNFANYHYAYDDFDVVAATYTVTKTSAGTLANTPGDGGIALFTTNAGTPLAGDIVSMQYPAANFSLTLGKKLFFQAKLQLADMTNPAVNAGLIQTTTTPFTVTDGIWFSKATGTTNWFINHAVGSVVTQTQIPTAITSLILANVPFELAFYFNRLGEIVGYMDLQLAGYLPQSNTFQIAAGLTTRITPASLTAVNLNPTLAIQSGTASSKTMQADFFGTAKER